MPLLDIYIYVENGAGFDKEADWVKAQCKLGTINVLKINNSLIGLLMTCYNLIMTVPL